MPARHGDYRARCRRDEPITALSSKTEGSGGRPPSTTKKETKEDVLGAIHADPSDQILVGIRRFDLEKMELEKRTNRKNENKKMKKKKRRRDDLQNLLTIGFFSQIHR